MINFAGYLVNFLKNCTGVDANNLEWTLVQVMVCCLQAIYLSIKNARAVDEMSTAFIQDSIFQFVWYCLSGRGNTCFIHVTSWDCHHSLSPIRPFAQQLVQINIKENIKAPQYFQLVMGIDLWPVDSPHMGPGMWKEVSCDVIMCKMMTLQISRLIYVCVVYIYIYMYIYIYINALLVPCRSIFWTMRSSRGEYIESPWLSVVACRLNLYGQTYWLNQVELYCYF